MKLSLPAKWNFMTIRKKLTMLFLLTAVIILSVNICMIYFFNRMTGRIEDVYLSNVVLNDLSDTLDLVQASLEDYLNTKSSDSMEAYFVNEEDYREKIESLSDLVTDNEILLMQKNIRSLSESYLGLTDEALQAKRGRNVEKYSELYEEASLLNTEIHSMIYGLSNTQFRENFSTYQIMIDSIRYMLLMSMLMLIFLLIGDIVFIIMSTRMITQPLRQLAGAADEVAKGNLDIEPVPVGSMDEVGIVTEAFNQMLGSIREYIVRIRENVDRELLMQNSLKDAQLKYLQAQINPHFLFNTLNAGAQLAMIEGAGQTETFLENVAEFYRYNVRRHDDDASIMEEVRLVDSYIYILNVRFSGEIHFEKDIDEGLLEVRVPSMILQPIVENAVNYGIRGLDRQGRIELDVYGEGENIYISVWDNGRGMSRERIEEVTNGSAQGSTEDAGSNGVGLKNVTERLRLYYQGRASLSILSEGRDMGTEILITIPKEVKGYVPDHAGR